MKNIEFFLLSGITSSFPKLKGMGVLANYLIKFFQRKNRPLITVQRLGITMQLDPMECVDSSLLFYPQLYDYKELAFLSQILNKDSIFIDIGANIGLYSLFASKIIGLEGKIIAIEADPYNYKKLSTNILLNNINYITSINAGVSDKNEILMLGLNTTGNRGGNSFINVNNNKTISVPCNTLYSYIYENCKKVDVLKIDIEGFEFKVFNHFFHKSPKSLFPKYLIVEINDFFKEQGDVVNLLLNNGYKIISFHGLNGLFKLT